MQRIRAMRSRMTGRTAAGITGTSRRQPSLHKYQFEQILEQTEDTPCESARSSLRAHCRFILNRLPLGASRRIRAAAYDCFKPAILHTARPRSIRRRQATKTSRRAALLFVESKPTLSSPASDQFCILDVSPRFGDLEPAQLRTVFWARASASARFFNTAG